MGKAAADAAEADADGLGSRELLIRCEGSCGACWVFRREPCAAPSSCEPAASRDAFDSLGLRDEVVGCRSVEGALLREVGAVPEVDWSWRLDDVRGGATGGW